MDVSRKIRLWQKFASIAAVGAAIVALPLYYSIASLRGELQSARAEAAAIDPERQLLRLMRALQSHRLHAARWLGGDAAARPQLRADAAEMATALEAASRAFDTGSGSRLRAHEAAGSLGRQIAALHAQVAARTIDRADSLVRHGQLVVAVQTWIDATARSEGLLLDAGPASAALLCAGLSHLARVQAALALVLMRDAPPAAAAGSIERRVALAALLDRMRLGSADAAQALDRAMEADSSLRVSLGPRVRLAADVQRRAADLVEQEIERPARRAGRAPADGRPLAGVADAGVLSFDVQIAAALEAQAELTDAALTAAAAIIAERRTDCLRTLMTVALIVGMGGAMVVSLMWSTARSATLTVVQASRIAHAFGRERAAGGQGIGVPGEQALDLGAATVAQLLGAIQRSSGANAAAASRDAPPPAPLGDRA